MRVYLCMSARVCVGGGGGDDVCVRDVERVGGRYCVWANHGPHLTSSVSPRFKSLHSMSLPVCKNSFPVLAAVSTKCALLNRCGRTMVIAVSSSGSTWGREGWWEGWWGESDRGLEERLDKA